MLFGDYIKLYRKAKDLHKGSIIIKDFGTIFINNEENDPFTVKYFYDINDNDKMLKGKTGIDVIKDREILENISKFRKEVIEKEIISFIDTHNLWD
jgi:hypothetical protein